MYFLSPFMDINYLSDEQQNKKNIKCFPTSCSPFRADTFALTISFRRQTIFVYLVEQTEWIKWLRISLI